MKKTLIAIPVALLMIGCGAGDFESEMTNALSDAMDEATEELTSEEVVEETPDEEEVVESKYHYDTDFELFKEAVKNKNIQGVSAFASSDAIDAEEVLMYFEDQEFMDKLMSMTYADLTTEETDAGVSLVCNVFVSGQDESGEVYESSVMLYFSQGDPSLQLDLVMVAG